MTKYEIILDGLQAFGVEISSSGRFVAMRGFATQQLAERWISQQKAAFAAVAANAANHVPHWQPED